MALLKRVVFGLLVLNLLQLTGCASQYESRQSRGAPSLPSRAAFLNHANIATPRLALVIANTYSKAVAPGADRWRPLSSPVHDADDMVSALRTQGFIIVGGSPHVDIGRQKFLDLLRETKHEAATQPDSIVLLYYSGHGFTRGGRDFLVPSDAAPAGDDTDVRNTIAVSEVLSQLARTDDGVNIILLDACRSADERRKNLGSLTEEKSIPPKTFVSYATTFGATVYSESGSTARSNFALGWTEAIKQAGALDSLETIHYRVSSNIVNNTQLQQRPVFQFGSGFDPKSFMPFPGSSSNSKPQANPNVEGWSAIRQLFARCIAPSLSKYGLAPGAAAAERWELSMRTEFQNCANRLGREQPSFAPELTKFKVRDDTMAALVAQAAQEGDPLALLMLGLNDLTNYSDGAGLFKPKTSVDAPLAPGTGPSRMTAWDEITRSARLGYAPAEFLAGMALVFGTGMPAPNPPLDPALGVEFLDRAQRGGYGDAALLLAAGYSTGIGLPLDPEKARRYACLMTQQTLHGDYPEKFVNLTPLTIGVDCAYGRQGQKDGTCATTLLRWVAEYGKGFTDEGRSIAGVAAITLVQMHEPPREHDLILKVGKNDTASRYYVEKAAHLGDVDGLFYLGLFYERGDHGYPVDRNLAITNYKLAAAKGSQAARNRLSRFLQSP